MTDQPTINTVKSALLLTAFTALLAANAVAEDDQNAAERLLRAD